MNQNKLIEKDPLGKQPHEMGAKLDSGKAPILRGVIQYFPRALEAVANVSLHGSRKYAWKGWHDVPDGINRYGDALGRHLLAEVTEGPIDKASGLIHAAQIAWNALARLELILEQEEQNPPDPNKLMDLDKVAPVIHQPFGRYTEDFVNSHKVMADIQRTTYMSTGGLTDSNIPNIVGEDSLDRK